MTVSQKNRGKAFEQKIEVANKQYQERKMALIEKIPTPWVAYYDKRTKSSKAFPGKKSIVDFQGVAHGRAIAFDAKSTRETTRFDLKNVEEHQVQYLMNFREQGGIAFLLVEFAKLDEVYLVPIEEFVPYWEEAKGEGRKSVPYAEFNWKWQQVKASREITLDYLKELV